MDDMYGLHPTAVDYADKALMSPDSLLLPSDYHPLMIPPGSGPARIFGPDDADHLLTSAAPFSAHPDTSAPAAIKAKIASHPLYPRLLQAYIDCHKVGAPPEIARILEEIRRESDMYCRQETTTTTSSSTCLGLGADPELDEFMETYCEILDKYKADLARPFDEARDFLNNIEAELRSLCKGAFGDSQRIGESSQEQGSHEEEGAVSSDDEYSGGEIDVQDLQPRDEERDLKDQLLRRFGSHISSLKLEFSKKKKKGKLPREARQVLLEWWNAHVKWPFLLKPIRLRSLRQRVSIKGRSTTGS